MTSWLPSALVNHLWQSTLFVAMVWLAALALRRNGARVRYWLWVAASVKFLVPFSVLVSLGAQFEWRAAPVTTQPAVSFVIDTVFMPAVISAAAPHSSSPSVSILPWVLVAVWTAGVVAVLASWWQQWIPVRAALRDGRTLQLGPSYDTHGLAVRSSPSMFGPAVVGIRRPVLLLPADLIDRLTPAQVNALMAHERSHVSCHDNLAAAVHMAVEAIFWFHPIVWWIESRLIDERERACDEVVLQSGSRPRDYAEGILEVCRRSVASPLACVTGVGGSNLRYRIESIMREEIGRPLTTGRRCALACAVVTVVGAPVAGGMMQAQEPAVVRLAAVSAPAPVRQQSGGSTFEVASATNLSAQIPVSDSAPAFEVASIRPSPQAPTTPPVWAMPQPGGRWTTSQADIPYIVSQVYGYELPGQVVGAPEWATRARFDINAKAEGDPPAATLTLMAQRLLAERFKLTFHIERRPVEVYVLVPARSDGTFGAGLTPPVIDCEAWAAARARGAVPDPLPPQPRNRPACGVRTIRNGPIMRLAVGGMPAETLAFFVQGFLRNAAGLTSRVPVLDRTGLKGRFDIELEFLQMAPSLSVDGGAAPAGQTIFDAVRDQLGLKLEKRTEAIDVFVIDQVEMPTAD